MSSCVRDFGCSQRLATRQSTELARNHALGIRAWGFFHGLIDIFVAALWGSGYPPAALAAFGPELAPRTRILGRRSRMVLWRLFRRSVCCF